MNLSKQIQKLHSEDTSVTWGRSFTMKIEAFLNNLSYLMIGSMRLFLKVGGLISANLVDIGFGSVVWGLVLHDYQQVVPFWFTTMVGVFISLVMTRAQIYFNEQIFREDVEWTPRVIVYTSINVLLTLFDTILDISILAYFMFNRSPLDLYEIVVYETVPGMFWVFAGVIFFLSTFGDAINMMFFTEHDRKEKNVPNNSRRQRGTKSRPTNLPGRAVQTRYNPGSRPSTRRPSSRPKQSRPATPPSKVRGDLDY